jgi:hypothetical protein
MLEMKGELTSEITIHLRSENMTNGDSKFDLILGKRSIEPSMVLL